MQSRVPNLVSKKFFLSLIELEFEECHQFPNNQSTIQCYACESLIIIGIISLF